MNEKLYLYKTFTQFATTLGLLNRLTEKESKKLLIENFKIHPDGEQIIPYIKKITITKDEDIKFLFNETIRICDELGPSREYITLLMILQSIGDVVAHPDNLKENRITQSVIDKFKVEIANINLQIPQPPLFNMLLETRSLIEWTSIYAIYPFIPKRIKGNGKPVLLIPPYLGDDYSTSFVR